MAARRRQRRQRQSMLCVSERASRQEKEAEIGPPFPPPRSLSLAVRPPAPLLNPRISSIHVIWHYVPKLFHLGFLLLCPSAWGNNRH